MDKFSIWSEILEKTPACEVHEMKQVLGIKVISEIEDLRGEIEMIISITEETFPDLSPPKIGPVLKSVERTLIIKNINLFLENIHLNGIRLKESPTNIVTYVQTEGQQGDETVGSSLSDLNLCSLSRNPNAENIEAEKLNVLDMGTIVNDLRASLVKERDALLEMLEKCRDKMERKHEESQGTELDKPNLIPSMRELKDFSSKLEEQWLNQQKADELEDIVQRNRNTEYNMVKDRSKSTSDVQEKGRPRKHDLPMTRSAGPSENRKDINPRLGQINVRHRRLIIPNQVSEKSQVHMRPIPPRSAKPPTARPSSIPSRRHRYSLPNTAGTAFGHS